MQRLAVTEANNIKQYLKQLNEQAKAMVKAGLSDNLIKLSLRNLMSSLPDTALQNLLDIAEYENRFSIKTISKYISDELTISTRESLEKSLINNSIPVGSRNESHGLKLTTAYKRFARNKADEVTQIIRDSRTANVEDVEALLDERFGGLQSTQALSLSVVAVNFTAAVARDAIDIPMIWVTALDQYVCEYCENNHGELIDDVGVPPAHWGCRCHIEPA